MNLLTRPFRKQKKRRHVEATLREQLAQRLPDASPAQIDIIEAVTPFTMTSPERIMALCESVEHVCQQRLEGDIVECGVWKGGSMAAAARVLQTIGITDRDLWMFDTFEGMSAPTDSDVDFLGQRADQLLSEADLSQATEKESIWCRCELDSVKATLLETGYPESRMRFIKGKVEETLPLETPEQIAILRLDTDWYESTLIELEILYPKLVPGGVLIIDDYGHWQGCRRAVDEYFAANNVNMFLHRVDYTGRLGIKQLGK